MNLAIKKLEEIGESGSIKQFSSLNEMIEKLKIQNEESDFLTPKNIEFNCILFPEDDDSEDNDEDDDSEE